MNFIYLFVMYLPTILFGINIKNETVSKTKSKCKKERNNTKNEIHIHRILF